jgi:hypothetical protein
MNKIQYAIHRQEGHVISRVGNELAWPILDYEAIGQGGNYNKPLQYNLEKVPLHSIGKEWQLLTWTRYVPTEVKNHHRQFWGMKAIPVEAPPKTIKELCERHKTRFYYVDPPATAGLGTRQITAQLIGVCHNDLANKTKLYHWFRKTRTGYVFHGVTDQVDEQDRGHTLIRKELRQRAA